MKVLTATTGNEAIALVESNPEVAIVLMDIMMPRDGRLSDHRRDPQEPDVCAACPIIALDRQGHEGRPREMPGGGRVGLSGKTRQYRAVAARASACGCTVERPEQMHGRNEKVNILLVDDQPAKLLAYEVILKELGENLIKAASGARSARVSAQERGRRHPGRRLHAGTRRLRAGSDDPRASALPEDRDDLHFRHPGQRRRPRCAATRWARSTTCPVPVIPEVLRAKVQDLRRSLPQDPAARVGSTTSSSAASPNAPPS